MIKSCKRCENEPNLEGLEVGQKCLTVLRAEIEEADRILKLPERERLELRKSELERLMAPLSMELGQVQRRLETFYQADRDRAEAEAKATEDAEAEVVKAAEAEIETKIAKLEAEIETAKAELELEAGGAPVLEPTIEEAALEDRIVSLAAELENEKARILSDATK